jgi:hypothetical protein
VLLALALDYTEVGGRLRLIRLFPAVTATVATATTCSLQRNLAGLAITGPFGPSVEKLDDGGVAGEPLEAQETRTVEGLAGSRDPDGRHWRIERARSQTVRTALEIRRGVVMGMHGSLQVRLSAAP